LLLDGRSLSEKTKSSQKTQLSTKTQRKPGQEGFTINRFATQ
jgi:hypothetical protein